MMSTDSAVAREAFHVPTQLLKDVPHCMKTYQNESTPVRTTTVHAHLCTNTHRPCTLILEYTNTEEGVRVF